MAREALLIGTSTYHDPSLHRLRAPGKDVGRLADVLGDPEVGSYRVRTQVDETVANLTDTLRDFFADRVPDDTLVLYFSGHGVKDVAGELFLTATDTRFGDLDATAISASTLNRWMRACRARHILLILDCCYSGAFGRGMLAKAGETVHVQEQFSGRGLAIITATTAIEYAFEGDSLRDDEPGAVTSTFTDALIRGLETGEADDDLDQRITLDELYYYVFDTVRAENPGQTPCWWLLGGQGAFVVAARRPGTTARRPRTVSPTPSVTLTPDRGTLFTTIPAAFAGGAVIWAALSVFSGGALWSVALLGFLLVLAAVLRTVTVLIGHTHLEDRGIRVSLPRSRMVAWPSVLAVETRSGLFGRSLAVHRGDRPHRPRLALPAPSRAWTGGGRARWAAELDAIRDHSVRRGSPTVVVHRGWAYAPVRAIPVLALAAILLVSTDRPWLWEGLVADDPPDACAVLDEKTANSLIRYADAFLAGTPVSQTASSTQSQSGSSCRRPMVNVLQQEVGAISVEYALSQRTADHSAHQGAQNQLDAFRDADMQHGDLHQDGLAQPGYWTHYEHHSTARMRCGNVVTTLDMEDDSNLGGDLPDKFLDVAGKAVDQLTAQVPGLC